MDKDAKTTFLVRQIGDSTFTEESLHATTVVRLSSLASRNYFKEGRPKVVNSQPACAERREIHLLTGTSSVGTMENFLVGVVKNYIGE